MWVIMGWQCGLWLALLWTICICGLVKTHFVRNHCSKFAWSHFEVMFIKKWHDHQLACLSSSVRYICFWTYWLFVMITATVFSVSVTWVSLWEGVWVLEVGVLDREVSGRMSTHTFLGIKILSAEPCWVVLSFAHYLHVDINRAFFMSPKYMVILKKRK